MPRYTSSFSTTAWDEHEITDAPSVQPDLLRVTRVHTTRSLGPAAPSSADPNVGTQATFRGHASAEYLLLYTSPRGTSPFESNAVYTGFTHLKATFGDGDQAIEGEVTLRVSEGRFEGGVASGTWTAVEGSAKGGLQGVKELKGAYEAGAAGAKAWVEFEVRV